MLVVSPCALTSLLEQRISQSAAGVFRFWGDVMSVLPGLPGAYLRRAYYCWTLESCSSRCHIGFGTIFAHRQATVEDSVYLGTYSLLGSVLLRRACLIGSRASIISGGAQHQRNSAGEWLPAKAENLQCVEIGTNAWLGEACLVAADVGPGAMVAAGSVVTRNVPRNVMVAGNPARFVKKLNEPEMSDEPEAVPGNLQQAARKEPSVPQQGELIHE